MWSFACHQRVVTTFMDVFFFLFVLVVVLFYLVAFLLLLLFLLCVTLKLILELLCACSVVFAGFSAEALKSRILDGKSALMTGKS